MNLYDENFNNWKIVSEVLSVMILNTKRSMQGLARYEVRSTEMVLFYREIKTRTSKTKDRKPQTSDELEQYLDSSVMEQIKKCHGVEYRIDDITVSEKR